MSMLFRYYRESAKEGTPAKIADMRYPDSKPILIETPVEEKPRSYFGRTLDDSDPFKKFRRTAPKNYSKDYLVGETLESRSLEETKALVAKTAELTEEEKQKYAMMLYHLSQKSLFKGLSTEEVQARMDEYFKREVVDKSDVGIRMSIDVLLKCLNDGCVKK